MTYLGREVSVQPSARGEWLTTDDLRGLCDELRAAGDDGLNYVQAVITVQVREWRPWKWRQSRWRSRVAYGQLVEAHATAYRERGTVTRGMMAADWEKLAAPQDTMVLSERSLTFKAAPRERGPWEPADTLYQLSPGPFDPVEEPETVESSMLPAPRHARSR